MRINPGYSIKTAFHGIFRNGVMSTASILVLVLCMLVLGSFWTINTNIDRNLSEIDDLNLIVLYLADDADPLVIREQLQALPGSPEITYFSREENLEKMREKYAAIGRSDLLSVFDTETNPLPASFEVSFDETDKSSTIMYHISQIDGIEEIKDRLEISKNVEEIKKAITVVSSWLLVILAVVAFLVIIITIKLTITARGKEISLMKYIGATNTFITTPFVIEGIIIGLFSAGIATGLQYYLYSFVMADILSPYDIINIVPFSDFLPVLLYMFAGVGLFAGVIASMISIRKYLRS